MDETGQENLAQQASNTSITPRKIDTFRQENALKVESEIEKLKLSGSQNSYTNLRTARRLVAKDRRIERIKREGQTDPLTKLDRREFFERDIQLEMSLADRNPSIGLTLGITDLDNFGPLNQKYNMSTSDSVLREVAGKLKQEIRGTDRIGRIGGEEFGLSMPYTKMPNSQKENHYFLDKRLRGSIENLTLSELKEKVTVSIGATDYIQATGSRSEGNYSPGENYRSFYDRASTATTIAKLIGKNKAVFAEQIGRDNNHLRLRDITGGINYEWKKTKTTTNEGQDIEEQTLLDTDNNLRYKIVNIAGQKPKLELVAA